MSDQATQSKPAPVEKGQSTEYVILQQQFSKTEIASGAGSDKHWTEVGRGHGVNAQTAIKSVAKDEGTFIAVPARSWKPLTRKVEKVERDVWT